MTHDLVIPNQWSRFQEIWYTGGQSLFVKPRLCLISVLRREAPQRYVEHLRPREIRSGRAIRPPQ
jgi:hypothetical protein